MTTASPIQNNMNAGEVSPLMEGRVDLRPYTNGLKRCLNFLPIAQGPITRRPGTMYVADVKDSTKATRLEKFEFSTIQAYILEIGDLYIRFYRNEGRLENPPGTPVEVVTPYAAADVFDLRVTQSADVLYITHPSYAPRKLIRNSSVSWTLSTITFLDGPYLPTNTTTTTLTLSGTTGSVTVTASAVTGINSNTGFQTTDVGRIIRFKDPANNWTWLTITARASTTSVTATISGPNASAGTATINWRLGVWSATTGYPAVSTFFGDRLFFGGATSYPDRIDGSTVSDYENFAPTNPAGVVADNNAMSFTLNANDVNAIYWMADDEKGLLVGTARGEWVVRPSTIGEALTPTNINAKRSTRYGSKRVAPVLTGKTVLFVQRAGRKLREFLYVFEDDGFRAPDVTILSEHITVGGIVQLCYQSEPQSIIWGPRADGTLLSLTYEKAQEVYGWARNILGGDPAVAMFTSGALINANYSKVASAACIPASAGTADQVWMIVSRRINGATVQSVEYLTTLYLDEDDAGQRFFVDMGAIYNGAPATIISGLTWLKNTQVSILADGAVVPVQTVSNTGTITLAKAASIVHVGLGYKSAAWTQRINAGALTGTSQGKIKRIHKLVMRFFQTLGLKYGPEPDGTLETYTFRKTSDPTDAPPPYLDGDTRDVAWNAGYERTGRIYIETEQPLPMTLQALMPVLQTQD